MLALFMAFPNKYIFFFIIFFLVCYEISNYNKMKEKFKKTQNNDVFISPKWKNTILEMSLKSSVMSKLDHRMSRI